MKDFHEVVNDYPIKNVYDCVKWKAQHILDNTHQAFPGFPTSTLPTQHTTRRTFCASKYGASNSWALPKMTSTPRICNSCGSCCG